MFGEKLKKLLIIIDMVISLIFKKTSWIPDTYRLMDIIYYTRVLSMYETSNMPVMTLVPIMNVYSMSYSRRENESRETTITYLDKLCTITMVHETYLR